MGVEALRGQKRGVYDMNKLRVPKLGNFNVNSRRGQPPGPWGRRSSPSIPPPPLADAPRGTRGSPLPAAAASGPARPASWRAEPNDRAGHPLSLRRGAEDTLAQARDVDDNMRGMATPKEEIRSLPGHSSWTLCLQQRRRRAWGVGMRDKHRDA